MIYLGVPCADVYSSNNFCNVNNDGSANNNNASNSNGVRPDFTATHLRDGLRFRCVAFGKGRNIHSSWHSFFKRSKAINDNHDGSGYDH